MISFDAFSERLFDQNKFAIKLGLDNISEALLREDRPDKSHRAIVVGGTNGKGETSFALSKILHAHGEKVGLYTSPHILEVRERFRIDGVPISREETLEVGEQVLEKYGEGEGLTLTFFEMTTLIAALVFRERNVTTAIYEVGLGGRLDAVNALDRELVVISNIDLDHQKYLGDSLDEIVFEKMSLVGKRRAIIGPQTHPWTSELETDLCLRVQTSGHFSQHNLSTAIAAARQFLGDRFDSSLAEAALENLRWPGRFDRRNVKVDEKMVDVLFDAAHNPAGCRALVDRLKYSDFEPTHVYFSAMADKDVSGMLSILSELNVPISGVELTTGRALDKQQLESFSHVSSVHPFDTFSKDLKNGAVVCGSIFLLGEAFSTLGLSVDLPSAS